MGSPLGSAWPCVSLGPHIPSLPPPPGHSLAGWNMLSCRLWPWTLFFFLHFPFYRSHHILLTCCLISNWGPNRCHFFLLLWFDYLTPLSSSSSSRPQNSSQSRKMFTLPGTGVPFTMFVQNIYTYQYFVIFIMNLCLAIFITVLLCVWVWVCVIRRAGPSSCLSIYYY